MSLICIVTSNQVEGKQIFDLLSQVDADKYRLEFEFLRPMQLPERLEPGIDLLVYNNHNTLTMSFQQQLLSWRKKGFLTSVIMLSKVADNSIIQNLQAMNNFLLLEKPYHERDLKGLAEKILEASQVGQRKFRRFSTNQQVDVVSYKTDFKSASVVNNISMGGLCLAGPLQNLQVGDLLKINFSLDKLNVERVVNGQVMWVQPGGGADDYAGIKFIKEEEVYGHLLRDIG